MTHHEKAVKLLNTAIEAADIRIREAQEDVPASVFTVDLDHWLQLVWDHSLTIRRKQVAREPAVVLADSLSPDEIVAVAEELWAFERLVVSTLGGRSRAWQDAANQLESLLSEDDG